jgi:hypothetical protein
MGRLCVPPPGGHQQPILIVIQDGGDPQKIYLDGRTVQEPALTARRRR